MIYYDEKTQEWKFDQVTAVEEQLIRDLGMRQIVPAIAAGVLSQMILEPVHDEAQLN